MQHFEMTEVKMTASADISGLMKAIGELQQALDFDAANLRVEEALLIYPGDILLHIKKGVVLRQMHKHEDGIAHLEALLEQNPNHLQIMHDLAVSHRVAGIDAAFNPNGRAPETRGKWRMMQESKSAPRLAVEEAIADLKCDVINDDVVYVGALRERADACMPKVVLPDARSIVRQLKDMGYVKHTVGTKHQGPKIDGKERSIYYRPDKTLPSDFMPTVTQHITGCP
jgi:tetratricopeptide (TPR) repeat protein